MKKKNIIICTILVLLSILFTVAIKTIDVQSVVVGEENIDIGFASINKGIFDFLGENDFFYKLTEILGYFALAIVGIYGVIGLYQLIKRKSLFKVDKEIIALGVFYIVVLCVYVFFEKFIINYRPVLKDGALAASYPSSHTVLTFCVCVSAIWINLKLFKSDMTKIFNIILGLVICITIVGRLLAGVHWFTDIIGGIIISITLLAIFKTALEMIEKKN